MSVDADDGVSRHQLVLATSAMAGICACYSAQINHGSSTLLALGLDEQRVSLAWLAGPLSGLIMQPIVGVASDACTSPLGRRRPFLIAGSAFTTVALLLFSNAKLIAEAILGTGKAGVPRLALYVAVISFFLLDFSIQVIQAPLRALVTDIAPGELLPVGNMYLALFAGLGTLIGSLLASRKLSEIIPVFDNDTQALFALTAGLLLVTVAFCVASVREEKIGERSPRPRGRRRGGWLRLSASHRVVRAPDSVAGRTRFHRVASSPALSESEVDPDIWDHPDEHELNGSAAHASRSRTFVSLLLNAPRPFWHVFFVQLFTWFGFFSLFVFVNTWVGTNIYLGRGNAPAESHARKLFEEGVRLGGLGNAMSALVTVLYSPFITVLLEKCGIVWTYAFSQFVEAGCLMSARFIRGDPGQVTPSPLLKLITVGNIASFGIVQATTTGVPWSIIGKALNEDPLYQSRIGLFTTIFNVSQSFPQLFVSFGSPFILRRFNNDVSSVMFVGGILALCGAVLIFLLRVDVFAGGKATGFGSSDVTRQGADPKQTSMNGMENEEEALSCSTTHSVHMRGTSERPSSEPHLQSLT